MASIPSIAMIPSGYKATKIYSVLPVDGGADLTFARASVANRVASNGLIEEMAADVPRLDYSDGGCPSLLLEPQSTNLAEYSEDFSNAVWSVFDATKDPNTIVDPKGTTTGCRVTALAGANRVIQQVVSVAADPSNDRTYTGSLWIKSPNTTSCQIRVGGAGSNTNITISSEWKRFDAQYVLGATFTAVRLGVILDNEGDIVDIAFGQVEELEYPTSYIPTSGATATRIADTCSKTGLGSYINSSEGVLYAEVAYFDKSTESNSITLSDASTNNRITFRRLTSGQLGVIVVSGGGSVFSNSSISALNSDEFYKIAFKYKSGDYAIWLNGVEVFTNTSTTLPLNLSKLEFGQGGGSFDELQGKLKDLRVYDTALTDAELTTLTTL